MSAKGSHSLRDIIATFYAAAFFSSNAHNNYHCVSGSLYHVLDHTGWPWKTDHLTLCQSYQLIIQLYYVM